MSAVKTINRNQSGRGGARLGAGRKVGSATARTREIANRAAAEGITPLEYLLDLMRKPYPNDADAVTEAAYDSLRLDAAKAAAPYIHPRLATRDNAINLSLTGSLADQGAAVVKALADGTITPTEAAGVMSTLSAQARVVEIDGLERRVKALEVKQNGTT